MFGVWCVFHSTSVSTMIEHKLNDTCFVFHLENAKNYLEIDAGECVFLNVFVCVQCERKIGWSF